MNSIGPNGEIYQPTMKGASSYNAQGDVENLRDALKSWNTNEKKIISILSNRNYEQRMNIKEIYEASYGIDLLEDLEDETGGTFKKVLLQLFSSPAEIMAEALYKSMKKTITDKELLATVIGTATNQEINEIKEAFQRIYQKDLIEEVKSEVGGDFKKVLVALLQGNRKEPTPEQMEDFKVKGIEAIVDFEKANELANKIYNAGEGKLGTDEETIIAIIARESVWNLAAVDYFYTELAGNDLVESIKKEFKGNVEKILEYSARGCLDRPALYAELIHDSVKGAGTKEEDLIRIIVARSEIDLGTIKVKYAEKFEKSLKEKIEDELSAYALKMMLALIGESS